MTLELLGIRASDAYYLSDNTKLERHFYTRLDSFLFDGQKPEKTFHQHWSKVPAKPQSITKQESVESTNKRYELREPESFPNLRRVWPLLEARGRDAEFTPDFEKISSLYEYKFDTHPPRDVPVDFEIIELAQVDTLGKAPFAYEASGASISYPLISEILVPPLLLHKAPCRLTSAEAYKVVRDHIKKHIDPTWARVETDYDFCFKVVKRLELNESRSFTVDVNNNIFQKRKRKPKYERRYVTHREVCVFEMTYSPENYKAYTPIRSFEGKDQSDLERIVGEYLDDLMAKINEPLRDCPHCKGDGVVFAMPAAPAETEAPHG